MTNDERSGGQDRTWPGVVHWDLGGARGHLTETLWQCDSTRAGRLYQRNLFATREEADSFVAQRMQMEPDQMFNVEAIKANTVWN